MSNDSLDLKFLKPLLGELLDVRRHCSRDEIGVLNDAIASLTQVDHMLSARFTPVENPSKYARQVVEADLRPGAKLDKSPYFGLSLADAAVAVLEKRRQPFSPTVIWDVLRADDFICTHKNPSHAIRNALKKRMSKRNDVVLVEDGKWGLSVWYTDEELAIIRGRLDGMPLRDREAHGKATSQGMRAAKELRGVKLGARKMLSDAQIAEAVRLHVEEKATYREIGKRYGVSQQTIYNWVKRATAAHEAPLSNLIKLVK